MDSICRIDRNEYCSQCELAQNEKCEKCVQAHSRTSREDRRIRSGSNTLTSTLTVASKSITSNLKFDLKTTGSYEMDLDTHICRVLDYSFFCYTCSAIICDQCSKNMHLNHLKTPLDEAKRIAKKNSLRLLRKVMNYNEAFKHEYDEQIRYIKETLQSEQKGALDRIEKVFKDINAALVKSKHELDDKLNVAVAKKYEELQVHVYNILVAVYESHYLVKDLNEKITNRCDELEFTNTSCLIEKRISDYDSLLKKIHSGRDDNLGFSSLNQLFVDNFISKIGELQQTSQDPEPIGNLPTLRTEPPIVRQSLYSSIASVNNRRRISLRSDFPNNWFCNENSSFEFSNQHFSYIGRPIFNVAHEVIVEVPVLKPKSFGAPGSSDNEFCRPWGICCDEENNIYIADRSNNRIQVFSSDGKFIRKFGELGQLPGEFDKPAGIALDTEKNIIVADKDNHRIQVFSPLGEFMYLFGQKGTRNGQFSYPWDIAVNSRNEIAVSDSRNYRVQLFNHEGVFLKKFTFQLSSTSSRHNDYVFPRGICFNPAGFLMITDFNKHNVVVIDPSFNKSFIFAEEGKSFGYLSRPQGIICDDKGRIVIADSKNNRLQLIDSNGDFLAEIGGNGAPLGQLERPCGVALFTTGRIVTVDFGNNRIVIY